MFGRRQSVIERGRRTQRAGKSGVHDDAEQPTKVGALPRPEFAHGGDLRPPRDGFAADRIEAAGGFAGFLGQFVADRAAQLGVVGRRRVRARRNSRRRGLSPLPAIVDFRQGEPGREIGLGRPGHEGLGAALAHVLPGGILYVRIAGAVAVPMRGHAIVKGIKVARRAASRPSAARSCSSSERGQKVAELSFHLIRLYLKYGVVQVACGSQEVNRVCPNLVKIANI